MKMMLCAAFLSISMVNFENMCATEPTLGTNEKSIEDAIISVPEVQEEAAREILKAEIRKAASDFVKYPDILNFEKLSKPEYVDFLKANSEAVRELLPEELEFSEKPEEINWLAYDGNYKYKIRYNGQLFANSLLFIFDNVEGDVEKLLNTQENIYDNLRFYKKAVHFKFRNKKIFDASKFSEKFSADVLKRLYEEGNLAEADRLTDLFIRKMGTSILYNRIIPLTKANSTLGMSEESAKRMYEHLSWYNAKRDNTTLTEKKQTVKDKEYENDVIMLWSFQFDPENEQKEVKPAMVTATLLDTGDELKEYEGRILITCAHVCSYWDFKSGIIHAVDGRERLLLHKSDDSGYKKAKLEAGKARTSRFEVEDDQYKGIYVQKIYFVPETDMAFCILNNKLPGADKGIKLCFENVKEEVKKILDRKAEIAQAKETEAVSGQEKQEIISDDLEIESIGFGSGIQNYFYAETSWADPEYKDPLHPERITNKKEILFLDDLHKASGWQYAKYKKAHIYGDGRFIDNTVCGGDSGSPIILPKSKEIIGIISYCGVDNGYFAYVTREIFDGFKKALADFDGKQKSENKLSQ